MIDGVKLECNTPPTEWQNNTNIAFRGVVDMQTGEQPNKELYAVNNGLYFSIKEGKNAPLCSVRGSIATYYNEGKNNAFDFNIEQMSKALDLIKKNFSITATETTLHGFEFGVNVELPTEVKSLLECIKSYKGYPPEHLTDKKTAYGIKFKFQQYEIKIYDKGYQTTGKKSHLMRFEISVKRMAWVQTLGIKKLSDIANATTWGVLSNRLITIWQNLIYIDKTLHYKKMSLHHQKKFLRYLDGAYWCNLNKKQLCINRIKLQDLKQMYGNSTDVQSQILGLIWGKCEILQRKKGNELTAPYLPNDTLKNASNCNGTKTAKRERINTLNEWLIVTPKPIQNTNKKKVEKVRLPICRNCNKKMDGKKRGAKFCSLKCKNTKNGLHRTTQRQKQRQKETDLLKKMLVCLGSKNWALEISYKTEGLIYTDYLHQSEICTLWAWIRQITKVTATHHKTKAVLNSTRAKTFINAINKLNNKPKKTL